MDKPTHCQLCGRRVQAVTKHHLIPRTRHSNKRNKKAFDRAEVKERVLWLCKPCHNQIHAVLTPKQLEFDYTTAEALATHAEIAKFLAWVRARPAGLRVPARASKDGETRAKTKRPAERRRRKRP